ncbi:MAG: GNAT family N-acetyltransferase [Promethearchaeota archaeon]
MKEINLTEIRLAEEDDLEEILYLQKTAYQSQAEIHNDYNIAPLHQTIEEIKQEFLKTIVLKAIKNNKIIGSVRAFQDKGTCYIGRLMVHPEYQNQGIGTLLMEKIENYFSYIDRFELFTGYKSKKNLYLYQKLGYTIFKSEKVSENLKHLFLEKYKSKSREEKIKDHFENISHDYDELTPKLIPYYNEMLISLINSIPFEKQEQIKIVDLGCGTGNLSKLIKTRFPNSRLTCIDISQNMIELAKEKLSEYNNVEFLINDFNTLSFTTQYDVIVSSLAIHHLNTDEDKIEFYTKIYEALNQGGAFYNMDVIQGSSDYLNKIYVEEWKEFLKRSFFLDIINNILENQRKEDNPAILVNQLKWLEKIGFKSTDVICKCYYFAVYGGVK